MPTTWHLSEELDPALVSPLNRTYFRLGGLSHHLVSTIVPGTTFSALTPAGSLLRLLGRDAMLLRWVTERDTYWIGQRAFDPAPKDTALQF